MGTVRADIELISSDDLALQRRGLLAPDQVRRMNVTALVDSGAYMLALNENVRAQLGLSKLDEQLAELADGSRLRLDIVGPVDVRFANRATTVRAMVLPGDSEILLGVIPLEDMDVIIDPKQQQLIVNPQTPYIPKKPLK
jgi:clan AA aspartic protease